MQTPAACPICGSPDIQPFVPELYNGGHPVTGEGGLFCPQCFSLFPHTTEVSASRPPVPELTLGGYATAAVPSPANGAGNKVWGMMRAFCRGEFRIKVRIVRHRRRRRTLVLANTTLQPRLRT